jgi:hypothetical protein
MKYIDPDREPNRWIETVLLDQLEQNSADSRKLLADGVRMITHWLEPGLVSQLFAHWIERYRQLVAEHEKQQNSSPLPCSQEGHQE